MSYLGNQPVSAIGVRSGSANPANGMVGELFFNTAASELFVWDGVTWGSVAGGSTIPTGPTLPSVGTEGQLFYLTADDKIYYYTVGVWKPITGTQTGTSLPSSGEPGDVFYDTNTQTMYVWNGSAWAVVGGASTVNSGAVTPGSGANVGDLFFNTASGAVLIWDGSAWLTVSTVSGSNIPSGPSLPGSAAEGDAFYNTTTKALYIYNGTAWVSLNPGATPSGSSFPTGDVAGQLFFNTADNTVYAWNGTEWIAIGGDEVKSVQIVATLPGSGEIGDIVYQTDDNTLYAWNDTAWVSLMGGGSGGTPSGPTLPVSATDGELFYNTTNNELYVRANGAWRSLMLVVFTAGSLYPSSPVLGQAFFNTIDSTLYVWNSAAWVASSSSGGTGGLSVTSGNSISFSPTNSMASFFTAPATAGRRYVVTSLQVTNISDSEEYVTTEIFGSTAGTAYAVAHQIPLPSGTSIELLKQSKVLQPNDEFRMQASNSGALSVAAAYDVSTNTKNFGVGVDLSTTAVTDIFSASAKTKVDSVLLANDGEIDVYVTVSWTNSSNAVQAYYCFELIVPAHSTVELMEKSKIISSGHKLRAQAQMENQIEVYVSGVTV